VSLLAMTAHQSTKMLIGLPLSRAGSLPHWFCGALAMYITYQITCGSGLARDSGGSVNISVEFESAIAGKPGSRKGLQRL
jgi:hypothetical protein